MERYQPVERFEETCPEGSNPSGGKCKKSDNSGYLKGKCDKGYIYDGKRDACAKMAKESYEQEYEGYENEYHPGFLDIGSEESDEDYIYVDDEENNLLDEIYSIDNILSGDESWETDVQGIFDAYDISSWEELLEYEEGKEIIEDLINQYSEFPDEMLTEEGRMVKTGIPKKPSGSGGRYKLIRVVRTDPATKKKIIKKKWKKVGGRIDPKKRIRGKKIARRIKAKGAGLKRKILKKRKKSLKVRKAIGL